MDPPLAETSPMNQPLPETTQQEKPLLSSPQTPTSPSSSKKSGFLKTFFIVTALILFGILIGVVAARFLPMSETAITPTPTITISPSLTPTPTVDETATWQTYTNATYSYSFKYPSDWTLELNPKSQDAEFKLQLALGEVVTGTIFDKPSEPLATETRKFFTLQNNKYLLVVYSQCLGPGCGLGSLDLPTFTKFLSTFKTTEDTTSSSQFVCPASGWVDCMPILDGVKQEACSLEAMSWYEANCPGFQGAAL
jgi:hypothetical protein